MARNGEKKVLVFLDELAAYIEQLAPSEMTAGGPEVLFRCGSRSVIICIGPNTNTSKKLRKT
jgi:hypothetical protein